MLYESRMLRGGTHTHTQRRVQRGVMIAWRDDHARARARDVTPHGHTFGLFLDHRHRISEKLTEIGLFFLGHTTEGVLGRLRVGTHRDNLHNTYWNQHYLFSLMIIILGINTTCHFAL